MLVTNDYIAVVELSFIFLVYRDFAEEGSAPVSTPAKPAAAKTGGDLLIDDLLNLSMPSSEPAPAAAPSGQPTGGGTMDFLDLVSGL